MQDILRHHLFGLVLLAALLLLAATQVWISHLRYELSQERQQLDHDRTSLAAEISRLQIELTSLSRPERLRRVAARLGMRPPTPMQVIHP